VSLPAGRFPAGRRLPAGLHLQVGQALGDLARLRIVQLTADLAIGQEDHPIGAGRGDRVVGDHDDGPPGVIHQPAQ
jgi:hypothetical protein